MQTLRIRRLVPLMAAMAVGVAPGLVPAQPPADAVRFAADVEKARAHLLVSEELYTAGQVGPAGCTPHIPSTSSAIASSLPCAAWTAPPPTVSATR